MTASQLREALARAADDTAREYDVSTQLVRWAERLRAEQESAFRLRRTALVAAALVLLLGATAVGIWFGAVDRAAQVPPARGLPVSGLPVGTLAASIQHAHDNFGEVSTVQTRMHLVVRRDGSGTVSLPEIDEPVRVRFVGRAEGRVLLEADGATCPDPLVLDLAFVVDRKTVTVTEARAGPCYASPRLGAEVTGAIFTPAR